MTKLRSRQSAIEKAKISLGKLLPQAMENIRRAIEDGDSDAAFKLLEYTTGKRRPTDDRKIEVKIEGETLTEMGNKVVLAMIAGDLSVELGSMMLSALGKQGVLSGGVSADGPTLDDDSLYGENL